MSVQPLLDAAGAASLAGDDARVPHRDLQGINTEEIISAVHARRAPMMHASAGLAL